jgi:hypothetical protein
VKTNESSHPSQGRAVASASRFTFAYVLPTVALILVAVWPLVDGSRTLFFRDVLNTHLEMKWFQAEAMKEGALPLVDPYRAGGQPHVGNPNTVALYPDNLLYLVSDVFWALNAHFWLHLFLAPFTFFWLARSWGLKRESAWAGGVVYGSSGYLFSCLNLYNLIAAIAWAPALTAVFLRLADRGRAGRWLWAGAAVWALMIVAGDPITAVLALAVAFSAVLARHGLAVRRWALVGAATALGTMLAAPMVLEFVRILSLSYRGHWGYSVRAATAGSWHPMRLLEWFLPLAYGWPNLVFWGHRFHTGFPPLLFSLSPGLIALALASLGIGKRGLSMRWAVWLTAAGLFFALGRTNPIVALLLNLPGGGLLRMPVKFWLLVAVGGSLLAALGAERVLQSREVRGLIRALAVLAAVFLVSWLVLTLAPVAMEGLIRGWIAEGLPEALAAGERLRWAGLALLSLLLLLGALAAVVAGRRRPDIVVPVLLVAQLSAQLFFLRPLFEYDDVDAYRVASPAANVVPKGALVVHGSANGLFESESISLPSYPDFSSRWLHREMFQGFQPAAGILAGRRFEFKLSPEGLDSFLTRATAQAIVRLPDTERLRILMASGVEWLILRRELDPGVLEAGLAELALEFETMTGRIHVYRLPASAEEVQFVGVIHSSDNLNEALARILDPDFDPRREVVVEGRVEAGSGASGVVQTVESDWERYRWEVDAKGEGALLIQRAYLPLYKARVDGRPAPIRVANLHRMAILLESGHHVVELWVDRGRFRAGIMIACAALVLLVASSLVASRGRSTSGSRRNGEI